jgi:hypothetical protein
MASASAEDGLRQVDGPPQSPQQQLTHATTASVTPATTRARGFSLLNVSSASTAVLQSFEDQTEMAALQERVMRCVCFCSSFGSRMRVSVCSTLLHCVADPACRRRHTRGCREFTLCTAPSHLH